MERIELESQRIELLPEEPVRVGLPPMPVGAMVAFLEKYNQATGGGQ